MTETRGFERRYDSEGPEAIDRAVLQAIPYAYPGRRTDIRIEFPELTSVCPWSGLPDFANLEIRYIPDRQLVELKSLKYYLHSYRNVGILQEHLVNRILDDLVELLQPVRMEVHAHFFPRGGMGTRVSARYPHKELQDVAWER